MNEGGEDNAVREGADDRTAAEADRNEAEQFRRLAEEAREVRDQRPWHFLYLAPEPHQQGSLRPIRAPVGVYPGRAPPSLPAPLPPLTMGRSPTDSRTFLTGGAAGAPARTIAEPAAATLPTADGVPLRRAPSRPSPPDDPTSAAAPSASDRASPASGGGCRWTVTRKIVEATP